MEFARETPVGDDVCAKRNLPFFLFVCLASSLCRIRRRAAVMCVWVGSVFLEDVDDDERSLGNGISVLEKSRAHLGRSLELLLYISVFFVFSISAMFLRITSRDLCVFFPNIYLLYIGIILVT